MEVGRLAIAVAPGTRSHAALVALPVPVRTTLAHLVAQHGPEAILPRRALAAALTGCSPRQRRKALSWLLQGHYVLPDPIDLREAAGTRGRDWIPFRAEPGSPWFIDYLLPTQVDRLVAARQCRRLPDGSVVRPSGRMWQLRHVDLRRYLLARDGDTCALCGHPIGHQPTVEHLVPQVLAPLWADRDPLPTGRRLWAMAPAHRGCNQQRGCSTLLPMVRCSPQLHLSHWVLSRVLPASAQSTQEVSGFLQLSRLVPPDERKAVWRSLRRVWGSRPAAQAYVFRGSILAYRGGRVLALPLALRAPEPLAWLRAELRAGRVPAPQSVLALAQAPSQNWRQAFARLRFL